ncbi:hypothetical protein P7D22_07565 [Lichenihabitans sp. Uapishka_5]|uniref:lysozyme inhibitor LprI family protein n=1 Tax=Lichenihabitans sp. Uapishka_5 TaxID=3037302 RepID=UPI0029E7CF4D|nr:hypothetical protein [Lichenihabitans sp. Uapishka_5]MDX7951035.1 hypothetical protein [Lichenihabitans sp. Uapishka_5]
MRRVSLAIIALLAATAARADAPGGFTDCEKAATADEKAICGHVELAQQDARMVTMFKIAKGFVGMGARGAINDAQVAWLAKRHACKAAVPCLQTTYGTRIRELQKVLDDVKARGPF